MHSTTESGTLASVTHEERGEAIKRRRLAHGLKSVREFAEQTGLSREAVTNAEKGLASEGTYQRLETWLNNFEEEVGEDEPTTHMLEVEIHEGETVRAIVRTATGDPAALEEAIRAIVRGLKGSLD